MMNRKLLIIGICYLAIMAAAGAQQPGIYEAVNNSNIRISPSANSQIVGFLQKNSQIQVVGEARDGEWYQVQLDGGETGYIYSNLLQPVIIGGESQPPASATETAAETTTAAAETATETATEETNDSSSEELSSAPEDAFLYIISPLDGDTLIGGKVWVRFGLRNMGIAPAGVEKQFTGHHHLLIDTDLPSLNQPIPNDDNHVHFGRGQTEYYLELSPGKHTLQLLLGDHGHVPHNPPVVSSKISIFVPE
jgi:hypothetical protein